MKYDEIIKLKEYDKIVCIKNIMYEQELTVDKTYIIIEIPSFFSFKFVIIKNNKNEYKYYNISNFIILKEYEIIHRNDKINKILK